MDNGLTTFPDGGSQPLSGIFMGNNFNTLLPQNGIQAGHLRMPVTQDQGLDVLNTGFLFYKPEVFTGILCRNAIKKDESISISGYHSISGRSLNQINMVGDRSNFKILCR